MSKVALAKCDSYDYGAVLAAVKRGLDLIGGPELFAKPSERILLKPNLLSADPPEKASTTHHSVFKAVAEVFKSTNAEVSYGDSPAFHIIIAKGVLECDGMISLPKLKTHGLEKMTGCIKNQFGCVPGTLKGEFHVRIPDAIDFTKMLVDLNAFVKPRLYIMDGISLWKATGPGAITL